MRKLLGITVILGSLFISGCGENKELNETKDSNINLEKVLETSNSESTKDSEKDLENSDLEVFPFQSETGIGLIDENLNIVKENIRYNVSKFNKFGIAVTNEEMNRFGLVNKEGKELVPPKYSVLGDSNTSGTNGIKFTASRNGSMTASTENDSFIFDTNGKELWSGQNTEIIPFDERTMTTIIDSERKKGIVDENGKIIIEPQYSEANVLTDKYIAVKKDDKLMDIVDIEGNVVKEKFSEDIRLIDKKIGETDESNIKDIIQYKLEDGTYGLLDSDLNIVEKSPQITSVGSFTKSRNGEFIMYETFPANWTFLDKDFNYYHESIFSNYVDFPNEENRFIVQDINGGNEIRNFFNDETIYATKNQLLPITGANLFTEIDPNGVKVLNSNGERVLENYKHQIDNHRAEDDVYAIYVDDESGFDLANKNGGIFSTEVKQYSSGNENVFVQHINGDMEVIKKEDIADIKPEKSNDETDGETKESDENLENSNQSNEIHLSDIGITNVDEIVDSLDSYMIAFNSPSDEKQISSSKVRRVAVLYRAKASNNEEEGLDSIKYYNGASDDNNVIVLYSTETTNSESSEIYKGTTMLGYYDLNENGPAEITDDDNTYLRTYKEEMTDEALTQKYVNFGYSVISDFEPVEILNQ